MPQHLHVSSPESGVALVELDRGPVNAVDQAMYAEITSTFEAFAEQPEVRVVVLTGRGSKAFSAGNDLGEFVTMTPANRDHRMRVVRKAFFAVYDCPAPVIGAINGPALGTGFGLAACCDLLVASERATFGLPEINVGVLGGAKFGARLIPQLAMRRAFFTGEPIPAAEFKALGAALDVVAADELMTSAMTLARQIAAKSGLALRLAKQSLNGCEDMELKRGYEYEQGFTVRLSGFPEAKEAVQSVLEKRVPRFNGGATVGSG